MTPSRPYLIRALFEWILANNDIPYLIIDASIQGVVVPQQFVTDGQIILDIGPSAVQGLELGDEAVILEARFGGVPIQVYIPILAVKAIYAKQSGEGMSFGFEPGIPDPDAPEPAKKPTQRPVLKVVK